ncbi:hypothetical protein [Haliangium ochraceum]|uniref:Uncharacterized protein n=1 Tax=Haliangium ochraceum (strain DSM 14365 / JCM 11303 / SMP-2) TaxID=502025 RepID=D0LFT8_HALO1|nr:hypothetical protein [Haliangium ochraceum]ACY14540.1 hypothetical protein Hoch_1994 [Haliangium ochraceum DSM 14365]
MSELVHEGGFIMYVILLITGSALLLQGRRAYQAFAARGRSDGAAVPHSSTPLYLAAAAMACAFAGTAMNFRATIGRVLDTAAGAIDTTMLAAGAYESVAPLILGGSLGFLIILVQNALAASQRRAAA